MDDISVRLQTSNSVKKLTRFPSHNHSNSHQQLSIQKSRPYTVMMNQHLANSQEQPYVLKTASKSYSNIRIQKIYCRSSARHSPKNNGRSAQNSNPEEDTEIIQALNKKAGFMPGIRDKFQEGFGQKLELQHKLSELKRQIYQQRKIKDKVHLRNCKLLNACENSEKNTKILKDESRQNLILICLLASQCSNLDTQLDENEVLNQRTSKAIGWEQTKVAQLKDTIQKLKTVVGEKTRQIEQLKHTQTVQFKKMTNLHMLMTQLKQEKALLLNHINHDVENNS